MSSRSLRLLLHIVGAALMLSVPAAAHPHVMISVQPELVYSADGRVTAVRQRWTYDPAYSAFATRGLDKNRDGQVSIDELAAFATDQTAAFREHGYFTRLDIDGGKTEFGEPIAVNASQFASGGLVLTFTLPLQAPRLAEQELRLEIYDPNFFAFMTLDGASRAARLAGAPSGCSATDAGPQPIDLKQPRNIPKAFWQALDGSSAAGRNFVNSVVVSCL